MAKRSVKSSAADYTALLDDIKSRIRTAQIKAALAVNHELIALYWNIGRIIVERQKTERFGKSVVERLASDLQREFPGLSGFSAQNIWKMRGFYVAWAGRLPILPQPVGVFTRNRKLA